MAGATQGNSGAFTFDFGVAIAKSSTIQKMATLAKSALTLASSYYALKIAAFQYDETLRKNTLRFGGQVNAMKAMEQAQDRLIKGQSYFKMDDQLTGMNRLMSVGVDVGKNLDWINKAAHATGRSFADFSGMITNAINGNLQGLVDAGLMTQRATFAFRKFQGNTIQMQAAVMSFLREHKGLSNAIKNDYRTVQDETRRLGQVMTTFLQNVVGRPNDPGGVYGTIVSSLKGIADAFSRNIKAIKEYGKGIGVVLTWVVKNVGHMVMWLGRQAKKAVQFILGPSETFVERMRSMVVWLEFWKIHLKKFFDKYKGYIWSAIKVILIFKALKGALFLGSKTIGGVKAFGSAWAHAFKLQKKYRDKLLRAGDVSKFGATVRSFAAFLPGVFRKAWVSIGRGMSALFSKYTWMHFADVVKSSFSSIVKFGKSSVRLLIGIFTNLGGIIKAVGIALKMAFIANPVGLIITAVIALIAVFVTLYKKCEGFRVVVNRVVKFVIEYWKTLWNTIVLGFNLFIAGCKNLWEGTKWVFTKIWDFFAQNDFIRTYLIDPLKTVWEWVKKVFGYIGDFLGKKWTSWFGGDSSFSKMVGKAGDFLANANDNIASAAQSVAEKNGFKSLPTAAGNHDINKRDTKDYLSFGGGNSSSESPSNPISDSWSKYADNHSDSGLFGQSESSPTQMSFNKGAIQINLNGSNIDENKLARKIEQVIRDMERDSKMRGGRV